MRYYVAAGNIIVGRQYLNIGSYSHFWSKLFVNKFIKTLEVS